MADEILVETNWILDACFHQDDASEALLDYAGAGHVAILLPSFCLAEAIKAVETKTAVWDSLAIRLRDTRADVSRSRTLAPFAENLQQAEFALAGMADAAEREFWDVLGRIVTVARLVEPTKEGVALTARVRDLFKLSPADSAVLATVSEARRTGVCSSFMSRDGIFGTPGPRGLMEREGIVYHSNAAPIVGPIRQRLERESR
jgi:hypothetical protein